MGSAGPALPLITSQRQLTELLQQIHTIQKTLSCTFKTLILSVKKKLTIFQDTGCVWAQKAGRVERELKKW